jgi:hypothetical protein
MEASSVLISKTTRIYRSSDVILDQNRDIELAANHIFLKDRTETGVTSATDRDLQVLCHLIDDVGSTLIDALQKLKVQGAKGRW